MQVITGISGKYRWLRQPVWFWQVAELERAGWYRDERSGSIRPVMVLRETLRPDTEEHPAS